MPSASLRRWQNDRATELDQLEGAHAAVGGVGPGRRWATRQVNHAYALLLSSQFQGFCRDLHTECVDHIVSAVDPAILRNVLRIEFTFSRKLDKGNPNPGNIGSDFTRLGLLSFWSDVQSDDARNRDRQSKLECLGDWRNAIAHQDFDPSQSLTPSTLTLPTVRRWRRACNALAVSFDRVAARHLRTIGCSPW